MIKVTNLITNIENLINEKEALEVFNTSNIKELNQLSGVVKFEKF